ncbi:YeeE/YedE family protein [Aeromonas dhakensis]|uniref:YeeE/YedE family protein n=2 Tax=Aeromonas dhakensis TaxID=196024 RepID=UPI00043ABE82|nr:YeeE/YedE family protein [Aeromonas dhakensis]AHV34495.1 transporter [Aeromonas hydrophila YL17]EIM1708266.1 YeeE/YedE family protein [Aeromonas dhakensis]MBL0674999.1 YeeE/YedE family protein [Aeromonas dhakensis]MBW3730525.1 YeeE/YedE family protein [Aeromonas dhakensis]MDM5053080.1 YeeE/YedE family protein [Aeromonas dhakensis]
MTLLTSLLAGLLFGLGLAISGMIDPARVTGFLDLAGAWDPSLGFVMGGALLVFMPGYFLLVKPRRLSLLGEPMAVVPATKLDRRLIGGSALFGIGWGLVGICPGPALSLISSGQPMILLFVAAMVAGILLVDRVLVKVREKRCHARSA